MAYCGVRQGRVDVCQGGQERVYVVPVSLIHYRCPRRRFGIPSAPIPDSVFTTFEHRYSERGGRHPHSPFAYCSMAWRKVLACLRRPPWPPELFHAPGSTQRRPSP